MDLREIPGVEIRRHPWEVARARFFRQVLEAAGLLARRLAVLDVGAGDGYLAGALLAKLPAGSSAVCFDALYSDEDLRRFGERPQPALAFTRERPGERFDLILLLDVVEHVSDDHAFLRAFVTDNLAPGGKVLVSVPAWPSLFSRHDEALKHHRRYSPAACRALLQGVGLAVRRSGGLFHSLLVPRALTVARERALTWLGRRPAPPPNLGSWRGGPALSRAIEGALAADTGLSLGWSRLAGMLPALPGLSFWALCEVDAPAEPEAARS